jgi:hypothetical protein
MASARTYTVKLKDRAVTLTDRDLAVFRDMHIGSSELSARISELMWLDIYILDAEFCINTADILYAIREVEAGEGVSGVKAATPFKNMPLKGLWHKHYFSAHFLVNNIVLALGKNGLEKLVSEVMNPATSPVITQEMANELAHRIANDPVTERSASQQLTGEWIIYLPHEDKNYYLCCNTHAAGDQFIYDRIMQHCVRDFPALPEWLKAAQASS